MRGRAAVAGVSARTIRRWLSLSAFVALMDREIEVYVEATRRVYVERYRRRRWAPLLHRPGGWYGIGNLRPRQAGVAVLDDRCECFLLALVPCPASVDELETVGRHPAGGAALRLEHLDRC